MKILILILLFIQYSYSRTISIESIDIPDELIHRFNTTTSRIIENLQNNTWGCGSDVKSLYCKENVCGCLDNLYIKPFIEIPDINGNIHKYILIPYTHGYKKFISEYIESYKNETIVVNTDCKTDTQCFSNKCFNNTCTYNIEANVGRCDTLYNHNIKSSSDSLTYTHCGRMLGEYCLNNADCSFNQCSTGICTEDRYQPNYSDIVRLHSQDYYFDTILFIIIAIIICCCCCCFIKCSKKTFIKLEKDVENESNYFM